jgi:hypothetical protein
MLYTVRKTNCHPVSLIDTFGLQGCGQAPGQMIEL